MYVNFSLLVVALLVTSTVASAQIAERYRYLVEAANRMSEATAQSATPSREDLIRVTTEACKALGILLEDKQFQADLLSLSGEAPGTQKARQEMKRELYLFVASFLRVEEQALRTAGLNPTAAKEILWLASSFRNSLDGNFDPKRILGSIQKLKSELCDASHKLQELQDDAKRFALVRKWVYRMGGVLLIIIDIPATSVNPPAAVGSGVIGQALMTWPD
jgi:hypothetical protein